MGIGANVRYADYFASTTQTIGELEPKSDITALFSFSVDKLAPKNKPQTLTFTITSSTGEKWTKQLEVSVNPPDHCELFQNHSNPLNPSTTISYLLPKATRVVLKIYNSFGQVVTTVVKDDRSAGYHQKVWSASNVASGRYICQLTFDNQQGKKEFYKKEMLVLK